VTRDASDDVARGDRAWVTRSELALVVAFWTVLAILTVANRLLDPRGGGFQLSFTSAPVAFPFIESAYWALLTPFVFYLASRFSLDRGSRMRSVLLFIVVGLLASAGIAIILDLLRTNVFPPPARPGIPSPPRLPSGAWFDLGRLRIVNNVIVYLAVLAAGLARHYSMRYRSRQDESVRLQAERAMLQAQLAEARLSALRSQLDPHFLFNTLHAVSSLVERDPRGVRRMISRLSELLRHSIEGSSEQEIELRKEIELLQRYLDIMQVRFQGRLDVRVDIAPEVLDALVPNLVLQPLVENAIKHGVGRIEGKGRIAITAARHGDEIVLRVQDDGPGASASLASNGDGSAPLDSAESDDDGASSSTGTGVGVRNTIARLSQLYGDAGRFALQPVDGGGMLAEITLPYHTRADVRTGELSGVR
jgi:two-component sensor histidine kinase